jgi:hypothetical protein
VRIGVRTGAIRIGRHVRLTSEKRRWLDVSLPLGAQASSNDESTGRIQPPAILAYTPAV